jgi:aryl-alcohol dehydrogenase-like predicted oxidoreductase
MRRNDFGTTGLKVTPLGFGAMHLNDDRVSEAEAAHLLNAVLDLGVNLIDTARGYGLSEARIGRHLAHRRQEFVLSTKVGYGIPGFEDWTGPCITAGVEAALSRLRCEHLDIVHLHSCPLAILARGEVIEALEACVRAGKVGVAAYSGENAELDFAIASGRFGSLQTSLSPCDQGNLEARLPQAQARGLGVLAKRPLAGAIWDLARRPEAFAEGQYWERWQAMDLPAPDGGLSWNEVALRFSAFGPGVASSLVGTRSLAHFQQNLAWVEKGPLSEPQVQVLREAFRRQDRGWSGLI